MLSNFTMIDTISLNQFQMLAYVGPGAGLTMLGALIAVGGVFLIAVLAPLIYPIRAVVAWLRHRRDAETLAVHSVDSRGSDRSQDQRQFRTREGFSRK